MSQASTPNVIEVLKNIVLACEANGLSGLPFVVDARRVLEAQSTAPDAVLVKDLRFAADEEDQQIGVQQDFYHSELLRRAADALEASTLSVGWETEAEYEMEQRMFHACGRADVPEDVRQLVGQLWKQYCHAAAPKEDVTDVGAAS